MNEAPTRILKIQCVALTGFMGSGKSTVGPILAERLHWDFLDLDREIVSQEGTSIPELFRERGEAEFRRLESEVLRRALERQSRPLVIALGGGTFVQEANRTLLSEHAAATVYLEGNFELFIERCASEASTRPLLQDPLRGRRLFEERHPVYKLANHTVRVADRSPSEIAEEVALLVLGRNASAVPE